MTDAELDRDWVPNGRRPMSTIARSFSQELGDIFRIDNAVSDLDRNVDEKRQTVGKNTEELADLEARIREMEERLRRSQRNPGQKSHRPSVLPPPVPKDARTTNNGSTGGDADSKSRPGTARAPRRAPSAGNMPPTPGASEDGDPEQR